MKSALPFQTQHLLFHPFTKSQNLFVNLHATFSLLYSMKTNHKPLFAHLAMFMACAFWGLMAPIGKFAMNNGIDGITLVSFRVFGGAILFWITSLFVPKEDIPRKDIFKLAGAALFGLVLNQCGFTIGLSYTSPGNASIMTTSMPIFAMILAFLILKEPITKQKVSGVAIGCIGALILILTSAAATDIKVGNFKGDLMCLMAQLSFAFYLSIFTPLIRKYSIFTINKWMFFWANFWVLPLTGKHLIAIQWSAVPLSTWLGILYVVFLGTFVCYIFTMFAQQTLRPTVISSYNYVQPTIAVTVSIIMGMGVFKWSQLFALCLIVCGVWLVSKSKSKRDMEKIKE